MLFLPPAMLFLPPPFCPSLFLLLLFPVSPLLLCKERRKEQYNKALEPFSDGSFGSSVAYCSGYSVAVRRLLLFPSSNTVYDCKKFLQSYTVLEEGNNNNLLTATEYPLQ